jgi:hypothetical protein
MDNNNPFRPPSSLVEALLNSASKPTPSPWANLLAPKEGREYKPSDIVQFSGIYRVNHDTVHLMPHEVTCVEDEKFPPCRNCGKHITYTLVREALHLSKHPDLR